MSQDMSRLEWAVPLVALLFIPACTSPITDGELSSTYIRGEATRLTLLGDPEPLIRAHIPGVGGMTLLVDTGAEFSWIDADFAQRLELERESTNASFIDIQHVEGAITERCVIPRLDLGDVAITNAKLPVLTTLNAHVNGGLGQDILGGLDVVFDGPEDRLLLLADGSWDIDAATRASLGAAFYRYELDNAEAIPTVHGTVGGVDGLHAFEVDTGSALVSLTSELTSALGLETDRTMLSWGVGHTPVRVPYYELATFTLDGVAVSSPAFEAPVSRLGWGGLQGAVVVFPAGGSEMFLVRKEVWDDNWVSFEP